MVVEPATCRSALSVACCRLTSGWSTLSTKSCRLLILYCTVSGTSTMFSSSVSICPCLLYARSRVTFSWKRLSIGGK